MTIYPTYLRQLGLDLLAFGIFLALGLVGDARRDWTSLRQTGCM